MKVNLEQTVPVHINSYANLKNGNTKKGGAGGRSDFYLLLKLESIHNIV